MTNIIKIKFINNELSNKVINQNRNCIAFSRRYNVFNYLKVNANTIFFDYTASLNSLKISVVLSIR